MGLECGEGAALGGLWWSQCPEAASHLALIQHLHAPTCPIWLEQVRAGPVSLWVLHLLPSPCRAPHRMGHLQDVGLGWVLQPLVTHLPSGKSMKIVLVTLTDS